MESANVELTGEKVVTSMKSIILMSISREHLAYSNAIYGQIQCLYISSAGGDGINRIDRFHFFSPPFSIHFGIELAHNSLGYSLH